MGYTVIAPVGDNLKALYIGMKEFPTERVILVFPKGKTKKAKQVAKQLEAFTIQADLVELDENVLEGMFKTFGNICSIYDNDDLIVNVATGDSVTTCAALSAAFANGLKAFAVMGGKTMLMPIMKLSYYNQLSDNKMGILKKMDSEGDLSLKELGKKLKMSTSLLSYHINGNYKHKGLKQFRLVETEDRKNSLIIKLSSMGRLLLKGYIQQDGRNV